MPFAPVLKNGLAIIRVEAKPHILEKLKQLKLVEERDGEYYFRKCRNYRKKLANLLEELHLCITIKDGYVTYVFRESDDLIEEFLESVEREILEVEAILG
ncbi:hypothetical protein [Geoglobus acetivorans]|uniref:Uncharacterized protein n=1 Tax=Geoglobus acetivorans TaxID=565033 RepID=A0A0A7GG71_GEOAI|nr:hypothetical protein GACE_0884 [Geoglobus acetivorans]